MNKVILMGRLTRDPEVRYSQGENATAILVFLARKEKDDKLFITIQWNWCFNDLNFIGIKRKEC